MKSTLNSVLALSLALTCFSSTTAFADSPHGEQDGKVIISSQGGSTTLSGNDVNSTVNTKTMKTTSKTSGKKMVVTKGAGKSLTTRSTTDTNGDATIVDVTRLEAVALPQDTDSASTKGDAKSLRDMLRKKSDSKTHQAVSKLSSTLTAKSDEKIAKEKAEREKVLREKKEAQERKRAIRALSESIPKASVSSTTALNETDEFAVADAPTAKIVKPNTTNDESMSGNEMEVGNDGLLTGDSTLNTSGNSTQNASSGGDLSTDSFNLQMGNKEWSDSTTRTDMNIVEGKHRSKRGDAIAKAVQTYIGKAQYVWGGESPVTGWDCSGMVEWLYARQGVYVPRVAIDQAKYGVKVQNPVPGDLVLQNNGSHIGIYIGNGKMVSAWSPDRGVVMHDVNVLEYDFYYIPDNVK